MTLYTVYAGSLDGPAERSTEDPAQALHWGRTAGPFAFVTSPTQGERLRTGNVVWTPEMDRRFVGGLHAAIIDRAMLAVAR